MLKVAFVFTLLFSTQIFACPEVSGYWLCNNSRDQSVTGMRLELMSTPGSEYLSVKLQQKNKSVSSALFDLGYMSFEKGTEYGTCWYERITLTSLYRDQQGRDQKSTYVMTLKSKNEIEMASGDDITSCRALAPLNYKQLP